ncbi:hypothetical protein FOA52_013101 [Chlamydomonas sp. UWO 241]|nr:hypothetical protein FOA52_013101 [Chlamydomonas sp. UWO 241]
MSPSMLTSAIKGCISPDELLSLVEQHGLAFNQIHCVTVLSHAAQLVTRFRCVIPRSGIERMVQLAQEQLPAMDAQGLATAAYALAKMGHKDDVFMAALLEAAKPQLHDFIPQALANTVWALATLGHVDGDFMAALIKAARPQLCDFTPQALANTVWALATLGHADRDFLAALLDAAKPKLQNFMPQNLSNTAWALAVLGHTDEDFMAALLKAALPQLRDFNPQDLANMMWALATLGHADGDFIAALLKAGKPQLRDFKPQALMNTAWALAVLDHADDAFMAAVLQLAADMVIGLGSQDLIQLFMCMLWLGDQHSDVVVPAQLAAACKRAWMEERDNALPSRVQLEVLAVVRQLPGCSGAASEQASDDGLFSIDIAVQFPDGSRLAVEVDGPIHFLSNALTLPKGATRLRARDYLLSLGVGPV